MRRLDEHRGILFKVADSYCSDRDDRDDLAQNIVTQLWRAYPRFDARKAFSTWMYRIAVNVAISFYRSQARRVRNIAPAEDALLESIPAPEHDEGTDLAFLGEFIQGLDDLSRALMILYLDGNPYAAIAEILGISETNVATKISRIKQKLRRQATSAFTI